MSTKNKQRFANFSTDSLNFDSLLNIQTDFQALFALVKKHHPSCTIFLMNGRKLIKDAKRGIDNLVNYRITKKKLEENITTALEKLNLLLCYLRKTENYPEQFLTQYDKRNRILRQHLTQLIHKLRELLPVDFGVQLQLFDDAEYHDPNARKAFFPGFLDWAMAMSAKIKESQKYGAFVMNKFSFTPPLKQLSIRFSQKPCPPQFKTLKLRQARKVASFLGLPQKQNGKDLSLHSLISNYYGFN